jgi:hypothetical protein
MPASTDPASKRGASWYRQPVVWLGAAVFVASMAGCVWLIVVSIRYADTPLPTSHAVFGVPVSAHTAPAPARSSP